MSVKTVYRAIYVDRQMGGTKHSREKLDETRLARRPLLLSPPLLIAPMGSSPPVQRFRQR